MLELRDIYFSQAMVIVWKTQVYRAAIDIRWRRIQNPVTQVRFRLRVCASAHPAQRDYGACPEDQLRLHAEG